MSLSLHRLLPLPPCHQTEPEWTPHLTPGASSLSSFDRDGVEVFSCFFPFLASHMMLPSLPDPGQPGSVPQMPPHRCFAARRALPRPRTPTASAEAAVLCLSQLTSSVVHLALPLPPSTDFFS